MAQIPTDERRFKAPKVTPTVSVVRPAGTAPQGKLGSPSAVGFKPAYTPTVQPRPENKGFSSNPVTNPGSVKPAAGLFEYLFQPTYDAYVKPYMPSEAVLSKNNASYLNYINPQYTAPAGKKYDWLKDAVDTASAYMGGKDLLRGIAPVPSYDAVDINSMPSANAGDYSQWKTDPRVTQNLYPPPKPGKQEITPYGYNNMGDTYTEQDGTTRFVPWQYKVWKSVIDKDPKPPIPDLPNNGDYVPYQYERGDDIDEVRNKKMYDLLERLDPNFKRPVVNPFWQILKQFKRYTHITGTTPPEEAELDEAYNKLEAMTERMRLNQKRYGAFASPEDLQRNIVPFGYTPYYKPIDEPIDKPIVPYSKPDENNEVLFPGDRILDFQKLANPKMLNSIIQQLRDMGASPQLIEEIINKNDKQMRIAYPGWVQSNDESPNFNNQLYPIKPNKPYPDLKLPFKFSSGD